MEEPLASAVVNGAIGEILLANGPLNLVTRRLLRDLDSALSMLRRTPGIRCVIVHARDDARAFCAGSDIKEFAHLRDNASEEKILFEDRVLRNLAELPVPTIAAIDAPAMGGGLELALACDLRVLRNGVRIGLTEARLGGLAGNGAVRLARLVGPGRAKQMLFTAAIIEADTALAWGVVNWLAEGSAVEKAREIAAEIAERGPLSNRYAKQLVDLAQDQPADAALSRSTVLQQRIFDSDDLHEGMAAFFARRSPSFVGG